MNYSKQRSLILDIVKENPVHPTAEWVYEQARKEMPSIGIATVYRNLSALADQGEIIKISSADGIIRFDGHVTEHYHMQCRKCGRLIDLTPKDEESLKGLQMMIGMTFGIDDRDVRVTTTLLNGVCNECLDAEN